MIGVTIRILVLTASLSLGLGSNLCIGDAQSKNSDQPARPRTEALPVRQQLEGLLMLMERASKGETPELKEEYYLALAKLRMTAENDEIHYARQVIDFELAAVAARNEKAYTMAFLALDTASLSKGQILEATLPLLENQDHVTQRVVRRLLNNIEGAPREGCPDYSHYRSHVEGRLRTKQEPDFNLVSLIFQRSPGHALQTFTMVDYQDERRKPLLWARHVVDDALWKRQFGFEPAKDPDAAVTEQLETMAAREEYWARLYAAEIIRQHPEFGTDELVERLKNDPHPLVQKTANAIRPAIRQ